MESVQGTCFKVPSYDIFRQSTPEFKPENKFQLCTIILIKMLTEFMAQVEQTNAGVTAA